jgi:hypothetical protein
MTQPFLCPVDQAALVMSERQGIEIDYCPTCRGVWLDRGELDKIIEKNAAAQPAPQPVQQAAPMQAPRQPAPQDNWASQPRQFDQGYGHKPHKRRKSFLEDLFD